MECIATINILCSQVVPTDPVGTSQYAPVLSLQSSLGEDSQGSLTSVNSMTSKHKLHVQDSRQFREIITRQLSESYQDESEARKIDQAIYYQRTPGILHDPLRL